MRPGQHNNNNNNKNRNRNRNRRHTGGGGGGGQGGGTGANRVYDSNGPDVKLRGTAQTVAEKYMQLARDAHSSGDSVMAESYYQFADHYYRVWLAAQPVGQPLQFSRRLAEEEYDEDGNEQNAEGDTDNPDGDNADGGDNTEIASAADAGEGQADMDAQAQGFQPRQNNRNARDNNNNNRDNREGGFNRNRQRWPRRNDRYNQDGQNNGQNLSPAPEGEGRDEPMAEAVVVQPRAAEVSDTGNWEAPSFLTRPVPAVVAADEVAADVDAPAPRPRGRKPRVVAPVEETPQGE